jgi:hypothetical protein
MKHAVNYVGFILSVLLLHGAWSHPESVRGILGQRNGPDAYYADLVVLFVIVLGTGYLSFKQARRDWQRIIKKA